VISAIDAGAGAGAGAGVGAGVDRDQSVISDSEPVLAARFAAGTIASAIELPVRRSPRPQIPLTAVSVVRDADRSISRGVEIDVGHPSLPLHVAVPAGALG